MLSSKELKQQAKDSLKGRWGQAVLLNLVPTLITIALIMIIAIPTALLLAHTYNDPAAVQDILRGTKSTIEPFKDAFRGFTGLFLGGVILLAILISIFTTLWALLFVIPGIIKSYSYSQSYFIYYDVITETGEKPGVLNTITASRKLMDGYKGKLFWLDLSFIGWHILAMLTAGIGYLWLNPYITATKAAFYEQLPKNV